MITGLEYEHATLKIYKEKLLTLWSNFFFIIEQQKLIHFKFCKKPENQKPLYSSSEFYF